MSVMLRDLLAAAGLVSLGALTPLSLEAQVRGGQPGVDTPRLLVATFRSHNADAQIGVDGAEAVRARVQRENRPQDLWVIPRRDINSLLEQSGFPRDTILGLADLKVLAERLRADVIVDGVIAKTATGVSVSARFILPSNIALIQPLPVIEARTVADAAKELERRLEEAQRSVLDFKQCTKALSSQQYDAARAAARQAIARYPSSTLGRLCLMDAFARAKDPMDSVIAAAEAVLAIDSSSVLALMNLVDAYRARQDTTRQIAAFRRLVVYRPDLRKDLADELARQKRPAEALEIVQALLGETPGDVELLKRAWLLLLAREQWKAALRAGEELVKADPSRANIDWYTRYIAAAIADSQFVLAAETGERAVTIFPNDGSLWALTAQAQRKASRRDRAVASMRRALTLDPAVENGWPVVIVSQIELGQLDSALASARQAVASGADRSVIARTLRVPLATLLKEAGEVKTRARWLEVVRVASIVDSIAPSPDSKFTLGLSAFQVGLDALQTVNDNRRCAEATLAEEMWVIAAINLPAGAAAGPQQRDAAVQALRLMDQYSSAVAQAKKAVCTARRR